MPESLKQKLEAQKDEKGKIKIGLYMDYKLLKELGHPLGQAFLNDNKLRDLLLKRNNSILAHGIEPVTEQTAKELLQKTINLAKLVIQPQTLEKHLKNSEFPKIETLIDDSPQDKY